jgi:hypothetical protein
MDGLRQMKLLFDELLAIYCRYDQLAMESESHEPYDANIDTLDALAVAIVKIFAPKTVGQVMTLPNEGLRRQGLAYLIEKDASGQYEQIDGYLDMVFVGDVDQAITPSEYAFDGWKFCEWIDQKFPLYGVTKLCQSQ